MGSRNFILASVAGGIAMFLAGYVLWDLVLGGFFEGHMGTAQGVAKEPILFVHLLLGQIVFGILLAVIFSKWAGISSLVGGLKAGATLGFLVYLADGLTMYATTHVFDLTASIVAAFVWAVQLGIGGAVVGALLGRGEST